ncbi:MAG: hypothetical protein LBK62_00655 [Treponema sp.]|nr:hypothetical protein [Treponema sp.]
MAVPKDWLPSARSGILVMADDWITVCTIKQTSWNIPYPALTELTTLRDAARAALETAKNETTRTPVANAQCKEAFDALSGCMRDFKRRYFLTPPLLDSDLISLGLKPHDPHPTPSTVPTAQVTVETYLVGRHELGLRITYVTGSPDDPANKGYRIWYSVIAPPGMAVTTNPVEFPHSENSQAENLPRMVDFQQPPANPDDLHKSFYTQRKKDLVEFEFGDSGKTAFFAVQIENDGKKGPWGPLVLALIP